MANRFIMKDGNTSERKIIHIDMDAFFVSAELLRHPELVGKPVIVGGSPEERGVVSSASYEARRKGIKSGMATTKALKLCPNAVLLPVDHTYYRSLSQKIMKFLSRISPKIEIVSVDEAYLDVSHIKESALDLAAKIQKSIKKKFGLPCSIGIGPNKLLAKIATGLAKPEGIMLINDPSLIEDLPVQAIPGIGEVTGKVLTSMGIEKIGQLKKVPLKTLKKIFGKTGEYYYRAARGIDNSPVGEEKETKSMSKEETFATDVQNPGFIEKVLWEMAKHLSKRMKEEKVCAEKVFIKIRFPDFKTVTRTKKAPAPVFTPAEIMQWARALFKEFRGRKIRLIGLGIEGLRPLYPRQLLLFNPWSEEAASASRPSPDSKTKPKGLSNSLQNEF